MYPEDKLWVLLENSNRPAYEFAQKHHLEMEEIFKYIELLNEVDIDPKVIMEYIRGERNQLKPNGLGRGLEFMFGDANKQHLENLYRQYEKIKKEDPDTYKAFALELFRAASDTVDGQAHRSPMFDTHIALKDQEISDNATQIRQQWLGLAITVIGLVGGWVTSAYQYFGPNSNNCPANGTST